MRQKTQKKQLQKYLDMLDKRGGIESFSSKVGLSKQELFKLADGKIDPKVKEVSISELEKEHINIEGAGSEDVQVDAKNLKIDEKKLSSKLRILGMSKDPTVDKFIKAISSNS